MAIEAICVLRGAIWTARSPTPPAPSNLTRASRKATTIARTPVMRRAIAKPPSPITTRRSRSISATRRSMAIVGCCGRGWAGRPRPKPISRSASSSNASTLNVRLTRSNKNRQLIMEQLSQKELVRGIGRWDLVALTINSIIGAGIFGLPSRIYGLAGVWSVLAYLVCAALVTLITLCFAEVGSRFTETGGSYLYARVAFGSVIGFEVGWLLWLARMTAFAALCNLLLGYLSFFWPAAGFGWTRALVIAVVVIAVTMVNVIGVREATLVSNLFTIGKLTPLLMFVGAGLFYLSPRPFTAPAWPNYNGFSTAVLLLVFAFSGFEMAVIHAGEIRDPRRHIAFALLTSTGVAALLYIMVQVVCIGTLPGLANSERPLVDASSRFLGAAGASIVSVGGLISVIGTLNMTMLAGPRILFAMAEQGQLPQPL